MGVRYSTYGYRAGVVHVPGGQGVPRVVQGGYLLPGTVVWPLTGPD